jgi:hypothetical protein
MEMSGQLFAPAALSRKKQPAVAVTSMLYDNSICRVKTNRLLLLREIIAVCCGNCREQISAEFVAIRGLVLQWCEQEFYYPLVLRVLRERVSCCTESAKGEGIVLY